MPHIHEKIDFTVEVFVINKNKVLLRKHDKYKIWLSVGGHVELDEDPNQAAIREVKEEVGLKIRLLNSIRTPKIFTEQYNELIPPRFMNRHRINDNPEHVTLVFFAESDSDKIIESENEKSRECRWFSMQDIDNEEYNLKEHVKFYAKEALRISNITDDQNN